VNSDKINKDIHTPAILAISTRLWGTSLVAAAAAGFSIMLTASPTSKWLTYNRQIKQQYKKLRYRRWTEQCTMSVKISLTVETSCTTNKQQIEAIKLVGYSWPTCSKQLRLAHCYTGVVNKLDCQQRQVSVTMKSTCRGKIFLHPNFWRYPNFLITQCSERKPPETTCRKPVKFGQSFRYSMMVQYDGQMDKRMDTRWHRTPCDAMLAW